MTPYVRCERCGGHVRSQHFQEHAARYCPARDGATKPAERKAVDPRDLAAGIRNAR